MTMTQRPTTDRPTLVPSEVAGNFPPTSTARPTPAEVAERVYPLLSRFFRSRAEAWQADDLTQTAVVVVLRKCHALDPATTNYEAWSIGVAKKLLLTARRDSRVVNFTSLVGDDDREFDPVQPAPPAPDGEQAKAVVRVRKALNRLPGSSRRLLNERFVYGRTLVETAARLGRSKHFVEERMGAAMRRAKELLEAAP